MTKSNYNNFERFTKSNINKMIKEILKHLSQDDPKRFV